MAEDRSLDEFVGGEESTDTEPPDPDGPEPAESAVAETTETVDADPAGDDGEAAAEPMAETFAWSADGGECAACGETVQERWRDGDALVCGDCKAW